MEILVNGKKETFEQAELPLVELLKQFKVNVDMPGVAVAVNLSVVPRAKWVEMNVKEGDEVEIIRATAGG